MVPVQGLDEGGGVRGPFGDDGGAAAGAAGLVAQFPAEDRRAGFVAVDDEANVIPVGGLGASVGVKSVVVAAVDVGVGVDTAEVVEVVQEGEDELETGLFGFADGVVEAGDAV